MSLDNAVDEFCKEVGAGREQALRERTLDSAWDQELTPARLLQHAERSGHRLARGRKLFQEEGHAATELVWHSEGRPTDVVWAVWCLVDDVWTFAGRVDNETIAKAYVKVGQDDAPTPARWEGGSALQEIAELCLWAVDGNQQAPFSGDVWDEWTEELDGDFDVRLGPVVEAPGLGRAMIVLEWVEIPDPGFADTERVGILDWVDNGWELVMVRYMGRLRSLLDELDLEFENRWVTQSDPTQGGPS